MKCYSVINVLLLRSCSSSSFNENTNNKQWTVKRYASTTNTPIRQEKHTKGNAQRARIYTHISYKLMLCSRIHGELSKKVHIENGNDDKNIVSLFIIPGARSIKSKMKKIIAICWIRIEWIVIKQIIFCMLNKFHEWNCDFFTKDKPKQILFSCKFIIFIWRYTEKKTSKCFPHVI